jgi:hypothetical protein
MLLSQFVSAKVAAFKAWESTHETELLLGLLTVGFFVCAASISSCSPKQTTSDLQEHVVYRDRIVTQTRVDYKEIVVDHNVYIHDVDSHKTLDKTTTTVVHPDGTKVVVVHEKEVADKSDHTQSDATHTQTVTQTVVQKVDETKSGTVDLKEKVVTNVQTLPSWRVAVGGGVDLSHPTQLLTLVPSALPCVFSVEVDRRILGPLWFGAEVTIGVKATVQTQLKVGVEF